MLRKRITEITFRSFRRSLNYSRRHKMRAIETHARLCIKVFRTGFDALFQFVRTGVSIANYIIYTIFKH